jgi:membrane protease YdiL (CAAX protease family)
MYKGLTSAVARDDGARARFYRLSMVIEWSWVLVVGLILLSGGLPWSEVGLRWESPPAMIVGFIVAVGFGMLIPIAVPWLKSRRSGGTGAGESVREMLEPVGALLPNTRKERRLFAVLSVTAGICEEILFRGFLLFYLQEVFPGFGVVGAVAVSSMVFGLCHLYQGVRGILGTGAFGAGMAILYVASGSLIVPIVLHALLDLRVLLLHRPTAGEDGA